MEVGRSVLGRAIAAQRCGLGPPTLLFGGIHGDEPDSVRLCEALLAAGLRASLLVVPALNPDGLAVGRKNNAHDVDLNRNFAARSWAADHRPGYSPGAEPLSEPETRALASLCRAFVPSLVVSIHQPFGCVNFDGPAEGPARQLADALGWPLTADIGYPTPGSFGSWWGRDLAHATLTLELPPPPLDDGALTHALDGLRRLLGGTA